MRPNALWSLTPREFQALTDVYQKYHGVKPKDTGAAAAKNMMALWRGGDAEEEVPEWALALGRRQAERKPN